MSLQVWLPLNGDLHNQGLSSTTFSGTAAYKSYGKLGGQSLNLQNRITCSTPALNGVQFFSVAFWGRIEANPDSTANWMDVIGFTDQKSDNSANGQFRFETGYGSDSQGGIHWHDNSTNAIIEGANTYNTAAQRNEWHHIVVTVADDSIKSYYDGTLQRTHTTNLNKGHLTGSWWLGESTTRGCIQDVRIYNHPLSPKEVEEIAKGLVLHYKLDEPIQLSENLMPNHLIMGYGSADASTGTWRSAGSSTMTKRRVQINDSPEGPCYGFQNEGVQTPNDGSCYGIDSFPLQGNTTYTISMWARIINGTEGYAGYNIYNISAELGGSHSKIDKNYRVTTLPSDGSWIKCWYTFTTNASNARNIYIGITTGDTTVTTQMCCVHIEKINKTALNIIYDSSGYSHNGTLTGKSLLISFSPRYDQGMKLSKSKIASSTGFPSGSNPDFSIVFWAKIFSDITYVSYGDLIGMTDTENPGQGEFRLELCGSPPGNNLMWFRGPSGTGGGFNMNSSSSSGWFTKEVWHQIALVGKGTTKQYICYFDGNQCGTYNGSNNSWSPSGAFHLGDSSLEATADFSDLRIYATVLTAAQIKELYNTSMSIDSNGNVYARELGEL